MSKCDWPKTLKQEKKTASEAWGAWIKKQLGFWPNGFAHSQCKRPNCPYAC